MCAWVPKWIVIVGVIGLMAAAPALVAAERYGLGRVATPEQIAGWDIDVRPDGAGLPPDQGTVLEGEEIYLQQCAVCHGEFGEGVGRYPVLVGGEASLATDDPVKTIGSYWPYATTVFDYIRRTMPFGAAQTLSNPQVYALTAFLLYMNDIVSEAFIANQSSLPQIEMPNRRGFIPDERPDVPVSAPCLSACRDDVTIVGWAQRLNITPVATANIAIHVKPKSEAIRRGEIAFNHCKACHSLMPGEHKVGPSLYGVIGRRAGSLADFIMYSPAMQEADIVWTEGTLRDFLKAPSRYIAGTSMPLSGLQNDRQLDDLIGLLKRRSKPPR